jgi:hypothetical protein
MSQYTEGRFFSPELQLQFDLWAGDASNLQEGKPFFTLTRPQELPNHDDKEDKDNIIYDTNYQDL